MKRLLILTDYRDQFWLTTRHKQASFQVADMERIFRGYGWEVKVKQCSQIDFSKENYRSWYVIYQSTEDPYLLYNSFIEDCLLALQEQGATLIPEFKYFRAHHNKVFMELLRTLSPLTDIKNIDSLIFGAFDEYKAFCKSEKAFFPQIVKLSEGSGSRNVIKVDSPDDIGKVRSLMMHNDIFFWFKDKVKSFLPKRYPNFKPQTNARKKIIVQNFIDGLACDYKVLVFGKKYYVLQRGVRPGDFRASGSGRFEFPENVPDAFLDFAQRVFESFHVPFISMDMAQKGDEFYLIEFQFVSFGTYTLEKAKWHFEKKNGKWEKIDKNDGVEEEFCSSVNAFVAK